MTSTTTRRLPFALITSAALLAAAAATASALPPPLPPVQRPVTNQPHAPQAPQQARSNARLSFINDVHDFGRIFDDQKQNTEFVFVNDGTEDLVISMVKPTCGCTLADISKLGEDGALKVLDPLMPEQMTFKPGEKGQIDIVFDPTGKKGDQNRKVNIFSNDRESPQRSVSLKGYVRPIIQFDPALVSFGTIDVGTGKTLTVRVMGMTEDFEASNPTFEDLGTFTTNVLDTENTEFEGDGVRATTIEISAPDTLKPGTYSTEMHVRTNDPRKRIVKIPVFVAVKGPLEVVPPRLAVGNIRVGQPVNRSFLIRSRTGEPFEVTSMTLDRDDLGGLEFTAKPREADDLTQYVITVSGTLSEPMARTTANLKISTSLKEFNSIEMPLVLGVVQ